MWLTAEDGALLSTFDVDLPEYIRMQITIVTTEVATEQISLCTSEISNNHIHNE